MRIATVGTGKAVHMVIDHSHDGREILMTVCSGNSGREMHITDGQLADVTCGHCRRSWLFHMEESRNAAEDTGIRAYAKATAAGEAIPTPPYALKEETEMETTRPAVGDMMDFYVYDHRTNRPTVYREAIARIVPYMDNSTEAVSVTGKTRLIDSPSGDASF